MIINFNKHILQEKIQHINEISVRFYQDSLCKQRTTQAQEYIESKKLSEETLDIFQIGLANASCKLFPHLKENGFTDEEIFRSNLVLRTESGDYIDRFNNRLVFPIIDDLERIVGLGGRLLDSNIKAPPFISPQENELYCKKENFYGLNVAKLNNLDEIIIVENYMHVLSLHQAGIKNTISPATLGIKLSSLHGKLLSKYTSKIIIAYNSNNFGRNQALKDFDELVKHVKNVKILQIPDARDLSEFVIKYGKEQFFDMMK